MTDIADELRDTAGSLINGNVEDGAVSTLLLCRAADEIERLQRRVVVLEMVIQEELDEFDCRDEANRMIVENIHERGASVAIPSEERS